MSETTTVAIVAVAAVGAVLLYEIYSQARQSADVTQQALLGKVLAPPPAPNPLSSLTSLVGPILSAL